MILACFLLMFIQGGGVNFLLTHNSQNQLVECVGWISETSSTKSTFYSLDQQLCFVYGGWRYAQHRKGAGQAYPPYTLITY